MLPLSSTLSPSHAFGPLPHQKCDDIVLARLESEGVSGTIGQLACSMLYGPYRQSSPLQPVFRDRMIFANRCRDSNERDGRDASKRKI